MGIAFKWYYNLHWNRFALLYLLLNIAVYFFKKEKYDWKLMNWKKFGWTDPTEMKWFSRLDVTYMLGLT